MAVATRMILRAAALAGLMFAAAAVPALAATEAMEPPEQHWSFEGIFGRFDKAAAQRGLQVYTEVCAACHSLKYVHYRDLRALGYNEEQVAAYAAQFEVEDGPDGNGEMYTRPAEGRDPFVSPYPNDKAAAAANGVAPPDLSLMYKARENGANYMYGLLVGYVDAPEEVEMTPGTYYNLYFPGHAIAMPQTLFDGGVEYEHGPEATKEQLAHDVVTFLAWAAEPKLEHRKATGVAAILFLLVLTGLLYATKRKVWADAH